MRIRSFVRGAAAAGVATLVATGLLAAGPNAGAAGPPPPPTATGGEPVTTVASGLGTPTSFAFGHGVVFEGDGGKDSNGPPNGGIFRLAGGTATKLPGSPQFVAGLAWHARSLYVSGGTLTAKHTIKWQLQRWSRWNGTKFAKRTVVWTAPAGLDGLNGIAFGPGGRLYVGVDVGLTNGNDHGPAKTPFVYDILSFNARGGNMRVFATGIRQPWQLAFAPHSAVPLVSDLGQDSGAKNPPDFLLRVHPGDNYGFPTCNHTVASACAGFARPFKQFKPHTDIMGLAIIGKRLYMTSFSGIGGKSPGGEVLSMPLSGGRLTPVVTGFVAPTVGLGAHGKTLYVGELTGQVFSLKP
jgi:glucose/arabinose dehydrogenase